MQIVMRPAESEIHFAGQVGLLRTIHNLRSKNPNRWAGQETPNPARDFNGALGEMMLAKHLDMFWAGSIDNTKAADVGRYYQVRATDLRNGQLIVKPHDDDNEPFVLARVHLPVVYLVGWRWGGEVKSPQNWRENVQHPAFFTNDVHDMDVLPTETEIEDRKRNVA